MQKEAPKRRQDTELKQGRYGRAARDREKASSSTESRKKSCLLVLLLFHPTSFSSFLVLRSHLVIYSVFVSLNISSSPQPYFEYSFPLFSFLFISPVKISSIVLSVQFFSGSYQYLVICSC
ncbi:hypothetical protein AMECASPLE_038828 [Ameca splendens]|uniref:Small EDRK-rich factor-like N-terminal domain-containing protein n=1 Tax=Ameca splendens TaxID=208324 RepID=A0ABV0XLC1_9TELE